MTSRLILIGLHLILLLLASTRFTIVTGLADGKFQWEYFRYFWQRGWGTPYSFSYSLAVVLAYLCAYALGAAVYCLICRRSPVIGLLGVLLCGIGFASFAYELTHWIVPHYGTWIVSTPGALMVLAALAVIQQFRLQTVGNTTTASFKAC